MQMNLAKQVPECSKVQEMAAHFEAEQGKQGSAKEKRGKSTVSRRSGQKASDTKQMTSKPGSSDMISSLKDLTNMVVLFGGSDDSVVGADQTPRKHTATEKRTTKWCPTRTISGYGTIGKGG